MAAKVSFPITNDDEANALLVDDPLALVLGSEAHGLADDLVAEADVRLSIPMAGPTESLNVAMAGTVLAFEVLRRRRSA